MATEITVIIDSGKVSEAEWKYNVNQMEPAMKAWIKRKDIDRKNPGKIMISYWKPTKKTAMSIECYTGGGPVCRGPITVDYFMSTAE